MNFTELYEEISREHRLSKAKSREILLTILETIRRELTREEKVKLRNFGSFSSYKSHGKERAKFDDSKNFFKGS